MSEADCQRVLRAIDEALALYPFDREGVSLRLTRARLSLAGARREIALDMAERRAATAKTKNETTLEHDDLQPRRGRPSRR